MTSFDLGRKFDAVTCLFSSIGYVGTVERLDVCDRRDGGSPQRPAACWSVEPWLTPEVWQAGRPHLLSVDEPDLKIARMTISGREGRLAIMDFAYLDRDTPTACSSSPSATRQPSSPTPSTATHSQPPGSRSNTTPRA